MSFTLGLTPVMPMAGRATFKTRASKSSTSRNTEEKGLLDWILGGLQKQDQLLETDPILKKVSEKNGGVRKTTTVSIQDTNKKNGGFDFGGLFVKK